VAIGETGLDYQNLQEGTADIQLKEVQKKIFKQHIDLAILRNKPIILHCRRAHDDALEILEFYACNYPNQLKGVAHCFLGNFRQARRYRKIGFKIAFNGIITYSRDYDKVIIDTPLDDILLETDSPYLAPVPYRGLRNSPLYIIEVAKMIAKIKNVPLENVIAQTTLNAKNLFNL
jgi:TatD DNase family protein